MQTWPNFFIVGTPKAGTTSLNEHLRKIPGIYMSEKKEPHFFCKKMVPDNHYTTSIRKKKDYLALFEKVKDEKIIGEASVFYLSDPDSSNLIHQMVPHAKILISLRDPVERAFSHYLNLKNEYYLKTGFHEQLQKELNHSIDYSTPNIRLEVGLYSEDVKRFLNTFGKNQVKIIIFEEFIKNVETTLLEILNFLDVNSKVSHFNDKVYNPYAPPRGPISDRVLKSDKVLQISKRIIPKHVRKLLREKLLISPRVKPKIDERDREVLIDYYKSDVLNLKKILDRKLPWPNF